MTLKRSRNWTSCIWSSFAQIGQSISDRGVDAAIAHGQKTNFVQNRTLGQSRFGSHGTNELSDAPPLMDQLAGGHLLEGHRDGGTHRRLVGWGAWQIGIEIDPRVG